MAFPATPANGQIFIDPVTGVSYTYNAALNSWPKTRAARTHFERLAVPALNTITNSAVPYDAGPAKLFVNGQMVTNLDAAGTPNAAGAPFSLTTGSSVVTWSAVDAGYNLETTDAVDIEFQF